jgi:hypothetical protein
VYWTDEAEAIQHASGCQPTPPIRHLAIRSSRTDWNSQSVVERLILDDDSVSHQHEREPLATGVGNEYHSPGGQERLKTAVPAEKGP